MPKEDGIVHRHGKLENGGKCLGYVRNLTEENIRSEVEKDHRTDRGKEHKRNKPTVKESDHSNAGKNHGKTYIYRFLFFTKVTEIHNKCCHTGNETLFSADRPDLLHGIHCKVIRCSRIEEHCHHCRMIGIKLLENRIRQQLHRDG